MTETSNIDPRPCENSLVKDRRASALPFYLLLSEGLGRNHRFDGAVNSVQTREQDVECGEERRLTGRDCCGRNHSKPIDAGGAYRGGAVSA